MALSLSSCGDFPEIEQPECFNIEHPSQWMIIEGVILSVELDAGEGKALITGKTNDTGSEFWLWTKIIDVVPVPGQEIHYNTSTKTAKIFI